MLILTRQIGDAVVIGENVRVVVLAVNGQQVKIGVDAPRDVRVMREELLDPPTDQAPPAG